MAASFQGEELKPKISVNNSGSAASSDYGDNAQEQLEIVFEEDPSRRRRASLNTMPSNQAAIALKKTSCFVHGFLKDDRLNGPEALHDPDAADEQLDKDSNETGHKSRASSNQSRLLTKRELSDMAFSIRELSKRLGRFKLKLHVKTIFILTKAHDPTLIKYTRQVAEWLLSGDGGGPYTVYVEDTLKDKPQFDGEGLVKQCEKAKSHLRYWNAELCRKSPHLFDIVLARIVPPVLSFALGSLGFLTKFDFDKYQETLTTTFREGVTVSLRLRLEATVMRARKRPAESLEESRDLIEELIGESSHDKLTHEPDGSYDILNDIAMDRGANPGIAIIEIFGDNHHLTTIQADGVCVATPTGSTAYNLAAGGSLCHPDNPVILLTAISPHTLSFRPIILPDTIVLRLGVPYDARSGPWVSFDGKERIELSAGDYVSISASRFPFPTVLPLGKGGEDWVESLSRTLQWNTRQRQKAFKD